MNNEEKNVMTIVTIGRIVESTLWYCLPPRSKDGFSLQERNNRGNALRSLTGEGTPFYVNCKQNGEIGEKALSDMQFFIEDVYGKEGRIVTVDIHNVVHVESSLILELFSTICNLRQFLEAFLTSALALLKKDNKLEEDFQKLIETDVRYYHAFAGKVSCILIADKFIELNNTARIYADSYSKSHNGINPFQDPSFSPKNDPSFRMIENEFHELNQDMLKVLNTYGEHDADFRFARQQVYSDCEVFSGKKQTSDINAFRSIFIGYFDEILRTTEPKLNEMFRKAGAEMLEKPAEMKKEA